MPGTGAAGDGESGLVFTLIGEGTILIGTILIILTTLTVTRIPPIDIITHIATIGR